MAHVNILSLPIETIQEIGKVRIQGILDQFSSLLLIQLLLPQDCGLKTLRLVCSHFNHAFEAQVLSTLVISVTMINLKQSLDMLSMFASRNWETSRAVQHAQTLKIKFLSPSLPVNPEKPELGRISQQSHNLSHSPPTLKRRLASGISSLTRRFK
jgi:hypothetical protein